MIDALKELLESGIGRIFTAAGSAVFFDGELIFHKVVGKPEPESLKDVNADPNSLFDLASVTKIFTTTALLRVFYSHGISIDISVSSILPEFLRNSKGAERGLRKKITFRHLLTHSSGLPSWVPYYSKFEGKEIVNAVLSQKLVYEPGEKVLYSDLGFMILGWALERVTGKSLNVIIQQEVLSPFGLDNSGFGPFKCGRSVATEYCMWRKRRVCGEVHDENAYALGGAAGHAGLFSTVLDVAKLGLVWLRSLMGLESLGVPRKIVKEAVSLKKQFQNARRGIGWALWSPTSPARALGKRTFGHTGFTGTSLYIDPDKKLVVSLLTNRVYFGRDPALILLFRVKFHQLVNDLTKFPNF